MYLPNCCLYHLMSYTLNVWWKVIMVSYPKVRILTEEAQWKLICLKMSTDQLIKLNTKPKLKRSSYCPSLERGNYTSSSLTKSYTNMLINADDGSLSTKDKSLPLSDTFSYCFISEDLCKQNSIVQKISEYCDLHSYLWLFLSKQSSRLSFNLLRGVLVYKIQPLLHSLIASLMWSFHCVDLRPVVG